VLSADKDQKSVEAHLQIFLQELSSVLEVEEEGEITPESVANIKGLLVKYWQIKWQDL
jgi:hypothetical protein